MGSAETDKGLVAGLVVFGSVLLVGIALIVNAIFAYRRDLAQEKQIRIISENHERLLENHRALQADLGRLGDATKTELDSLDSRTKAVAEDTAVLKQKLQPVKSFVRSGEIVLIE